MIRRLLGSCIGVTKYAWWINRFWKEKELELTYMNPRNIKLFFQQTYHKTADERDYSEGMNRYERQEEDPRISHATMKETKSCEQKKKEKKYSTWSSNERFFCSGAGMYPRYSRYL